MARFMFLKPSAEVAGDAYVKRSIYLGAKNVNVTIAHKVDVNRMDYPIKSGNDGMWSQ